MRDNTHVTDICGLVHKLTDLILKVQNICQWRLITCSIDFLLTYCEVTMEWYSSIRTMRLSMYDKGLHHIVCLLLQVWKKGFETADGISLLKMGLKFHSPKKLVHLIDPLGLGQVSIWLRRRVSRSPDNIFLRVITGPETPTDDQPTNIPPWD